MKVTKRDYNINLHTTYKELEDPTAVKSKQSSNMVFLLCALLVVVLLAYYANLSRTNNGILDQIDEYNAYMTDADNLTEYNRKLAIKEAIDDINIYNEASEIFLGQLADSERFSSDWVDFFDEAMMEAVGSGGSVDSYTYEDGQLTLSCTTMDTEDPKEFARYLTELVDEDGEPVFASVVYSGFAQNTSTLEVSFVINITTWETDLTVEVDTTEVVTEEVTEVTEE